MTSNNLALQLNREFAAGIYRHERGRLAEAEAIYRQILDKDPKHLVTTEKLGVLYMQTGRHELAEKLIRKVVSQRPEYADAHSNLGVVLASTGRLQEALACHRRALALNMDPILAHLNIALTLKELGNPPEAMTHLKKASGVSGPNRLKWMMAMGEVKEMLGDPRGAESVLTVLVSLAPEDAAARRVLARVQTNLGKHEDAVKSYTTLRDLLPGDVTVLEGLAKAMMATGKTDDAIAIMNDVVERAPTRVDSAVELAAWMTATGRKDEAQERLRRLARTWPDAANVHNALGAMLHQENKWDEAIEHFRAIIRMNPNSPYGYYHLALGLQGAGRKADAAAAAEAAIACDENFIDAYIIRGRLLHETGFPYEAMDCMQKVLKVVPHHKDALVGLAYLLREQGRPGEAAMAAKEALIGDPDDVPARVAYAIALEADSRFDESEKEIRELLEKHQDSALYAGLGNILKSRWQIKECIEAYRKALSFKNVSLAYGGNLMLALNYPEDLDAKTVFDDHKAFAARVQEGIEPLPPRAPAPDDDDPERPLRIGYISADFRSHVVMNFMAPILARHDRRQFAVTLYAEVLVEDQTSAYLKSMGHNWVRTIGMTDEEVAKRIYSDRIDILIDLSGYTGGNRLRAVAYHPAPLIGTYLGYPNTTGMDRVDFRLIDAITDPPGWADELATEKLVRLDGCFLCFNVPQDSPPVNEAPCLKNGFVTFGSFNKLAKISPSMLDSWARILKRLPNARLSIKGWSLADSAARDRILDEFRSRGIEGERILPKPFIHDRHYMTGMHDADIALDTSPYSGTTTTFDSLIMGLPVVTLKGDRHSARVSASMLTALGRPDWVAEDPDEYVEIAVRLASDMEALAKLRQQLRDEVEKSRLTDIDKFVGGYEGTLRQLWVDRPRPAIPVEAPALPPSDPIAELEAHAVDGATASDAEVAAAAPKAALPAAFATRYWSQRITFPDGQVSPGYQPLAAEAYSLADQMTGMTVLDVDARDGFWCFDTLSRGAAKVVGLHWEMPFRSPLLADAPANFEAARAALDHAADRCIRLDAAPGDAQVAAHGPYDLILLSDFVFDVANPLGLLKSLAPLCRGEIVIEAAVSDERDNNDAPHLHLKGDAPSEHPPMPNLAMLGYLLEEAGFKDVEGWLLHEAPVDPALRRGFLKGRAPG